MAKELTHILVAQKVLHGLKETAYPLPAELLEKNLAAYYLGAIIPDAFMYDLIALGIGSPEYARICLALHSGQRAENDQKAISFYDSIGVNPHNWRAKAAFATGIVTHTVTDRFIHDFVDHLTTSWHQEGALAMGSHRQLETLIDMLLVAQSDTHPKNFPLQRLIDPGRATQDCLFYFYVTHLAGPSPAVHPVLLRALKRAHAQQRILLKLFTFPPLYHIMNFSNKLVAGRLLLISGLFYPEAVGIQTFPILDRLDQDALANEWSFEIKLQSLMEAVTTDAIHHIRLGLDRLT